MNFERAQRKTRSVPMTPLVDVVFLLLIFFMLSTSFVRTRSLELKLPQTDGSAAITQESKLLQVFAANDGAIYIGRRKIDAEKLVTTLKKTIEKYPDIGVLLLSGPRVSVQQMVKVMDYIYMAGASNLSVASWEPEVIANVGAVPANTKEANTMLAEPKVAPTVNEEAEASATISEVE